MGISYSMCWEDPDTMIKALDITPKDSVLSIASGGENTFAILLKNPKHVIALDYNLEQIYLCKLKAKAIELLNFEEFVCLLGFSENYSRKDIYARLKDYLTDEEKTYWNSHQASINKGLAKCGIFENYLQIFKKYILPIVTTKTRIRKFLNSTDKENQLATANRAFNNKRFNLLFKIFFSEKVMKTFGRKKEYFKHNTNKRIADYYLSKTKEGLVNIPSKDNYFFEFIFTSTISVPNSTHPYLNKNNFIMLKPLIKKVFFIHQNIQDYLISPNVDKITKANLSNVFEGMNEEEYTKCLHDLTKICKNKGRICYWNNLVKRNRDFTNVKNLNKLSSDLHKRERIFFYSDFVVQEINK